MPPPETDGDFEAAIDWLRTKGLAKAAKKSSRVAAEGLVAVAVKDGKGVAVEVNSETDFVAKNSNFQEMVGAIASAALGVSNTAELSNELIAGKSVSDTITDNIAKIGENMTLRRMETIQAEKVVTYVHNSATQNMGQIGVLVAINGENSEFARQVAMHVAAANPQALSAGELAEGSWSRARRCSRSSSSNLTAMAGASRSRRNGGTAATPCSAGPSSSRRATARRTG